MNMRRLIYIFTAMFLAAGCSPENPQQTGGDDVKLSVDKTTLSFTSAGGEQTFTATASEQIYLVPGESWITVKKGSKSGNSTKVTVTVDKNEGTKARTAKVSVVAGDEKKYVEVSQEAAVPSGGQNGESKFEIPQPGDNAAWQMAARFGIGWNLGNHFDAHNNGVSGETAWGNPKATQTTFNKVKAAGFTTVRIPVTWLGQFGEAPDYKIKAEWLDRIAEVVGYAENAGLNVIINMHHDGADSKYWLDIATAAKNDAVHQQIMAQISAMWTQIAEKFRDKGDFLVFESFNEIHDGKWGWGANRTDGGKQYRCLNEWNQAFVDAVRAVGGNNAERILGIPAYCTNADIAVESLELPEDSAKDKLMVSVHCYDPSEYTLTAKYSEWGHTAAASKKVSGDNEADLQKVFDTLYKNFVAKGIPVYLGELGCVNRADARAQAFQQYYLSYYAKLSQLYGIPSILWDNGAQGAGEEKHAFIDHATGEYCSTEARTAVQALIKSYKGDQTLEQVYASAPK